MTHMLSLDEQMTGLKRKPSQLPGDQPPPKLLKQTTSTTVITGIKKESDIDNIAPPVLEKADTYIEERQIAVPYGKSNDNGSNNSTPPPILPRFPTLTPTNPTSQKYFGFEIEDSDEEDDSFSRIAQSIDIGDDSFDNVPFVHTEPKTACIGINTVYDSDEESNTNNLTLKRAETIAIVDTNCSNGEGKKAKLIKKTNVKKVLTPKKNMHPKKELKKEKSAILGSLESLKTIQKMPSGTIIEKIMKFGDQETILPTDKSLIVYEYDDETESEPPIISSLPRPSFQVVSDTLKSIEEEITVVKENSGLPKLECVSSEEVTQSENSDVETNNPAPTLQKMCIATPTKSPKKFIHGGIREIVFSFDTTGSMYSYMEEAKDKMREIVDHLKIDIPGVRLAFIAHGDYYDLKHDRYLIKSLDFGATTDEICNFFEYLPITHGGDADECYELVLRKVRQSLSWTTGSQRCLVMIGDSDPHEPGYTYEEFVNDIDWKKETKKLNEMGVRIYGMQVGYRSDFYRQISQMTGGAHLRLESSHLTPDMLLAVCLREGNLKLLKTFEADVMKRPDYKGGLDLELARLFSSLKNVADNIAMKFKKNLIEGSEENGKKTVKRSNDSKTESPGSKIAKMAKKALEDGKKKVLKSKLSPDLKKKQSTSDKIAKNLVKKAIKGTKDKKKTSPSKLKKKPLSKKELTKGKEKTKGKVKTVKKTPDSKRKQLKSCKSSSSLKKVKLIKDSKLKKNMPKGKQTATKLKAKAVIKAILKSKTKTSNVKQTKKPSKVQSKVKTPLKGKKLVVNKATKAVSKDKNKTLTKTKPKSATVKKVIKAKSKPETPKAKSKPGTPKAKSKPETQKAKSKPETPKAKVTRRIVKKETLKPNVDKKKTAKASVKSLKTPVKKEKTTPVKQLESTKKSSPKKSLNKPTKKPKDLPPREIASIAKFVTGPLSSLSWEQWTPLIAHEKQKLGNWSKGKSGCPGFCNSDFNKDKLSVQTVYEFAVSPPDSSKKYPVYFHSESGNVWGICKNKYVQGELERVIKSKGSVSVRVGTLNKDDDALFLKTIEHLRNMFDYAWNSNSSKDTARKQDLVKEGFTVAKV